MPDSISSRALLSYDQIRQLGVRFSREHLRRLEAQGRFPRQLTLTKFRIAWDRDEVLDWIDDLYRDRDAAAEGTDAEA